MSLLGLGVLIGFVWSEVKTAADDVVHHEIYAKQLINFVQMSALSGFEPPTKLTNVAIFFRTFFYYNVHSQCIQPKHI